MDINSYSYAPTMLDEPENHIMYFENDDMYIELDQNGDVFTVYAFSYDGSLDVYEEFSLLSKAAALYEFITANYTDQQPDKALDDFIRVLLYDGRYV